MLSNYSYHNFFERNIGIINSKEQKKLKISTVAVFGVGGLGGVICEILVRSGIENLKIVDNDSFEASNVNRQIYAFKNTIGKKKVTVTKEYLLKINSEVKIEIYNKVNQHNINNICKNIDAGVLALDDAFACIIISRSLRKINIPLIEGWAIPFANVRVFTSKTPSLEEVYEFQTFQKPVEKITEIEKKELNQRMILNIMKFQGINKYLTNIVLDKIKKSKNPSFAPLVWLTASLMSLETIKQILGWKTPALAPNFNLYDPFENSIPKQINYENN